MNTPLRIPQKGALDFLSLGALSSPARPGGRSVPQGHDLRDSRQRRRVQTSANLSDCFGLRTGVATAMVEYPIGELIAGRSARWG